MTDRMRFIPPGSVMRGVSQERHEASSESATGDRRMGESPGRRRINLASERPLHVVRS